MLIDKKVNILYITPYLPYPPVSGGRLQTFLRIKKLKERGHNIYLVAVAERGTDEEDVVELRKNITELVVVFARFNPDKIRYLLKKSLPLELFPCQDGLGEKITSFIRDREIDIAVYDGIGSAQYVYATEGIPSIVYEHNVEYEIIDQFVSTLRKSPLKILRGTPAEKLLYLWLYIFGERERILAREFELNSLSRFDMVLTCSERDADILKRDVGDTPFVTVPWGIEMPDSYKTHEDKEVYNLVFIGSMCWEPNRDAILWFAKEVFPLIKRRIGKVRLIIAGSHPCKEVLALNNKRDVIVKGFVPDISRLLLETDIFIAPVRLGSGVNVKIIEAMSYGLPVITTSKGAEGIEAVNGEHFVIANTPEEFLDRIQYLIENVGFRSSLGISGRNYVSEYHGIDKVTDLFGDALREVIKIKS